MKWTLKDVRPKVRSSWCAAKESYSGLENRICLKGRGGVVAGRFVRRVQALSSSCFYLLDTKLCPTLSPFTQGYKWILIRSKGGGGGGYTPVLGASCNTIRVKLFPFGSPLLFCALKEVISANTSCRFHYRRKRSKLLS